MFGFFQFSDFFLPTDEWMDEGMNGNIKITSSQRIHGPGKDENLKIFPSVSDDLLLLSSARSVAVSPLQSSRSSPPLPPAPLCGSDEDSRPQQWSSSSTSLLQESTVLNFLVLSGIDPQTRQDTTTREGERNGTAFPSPAHPSSSLHHQ